MLKYTWDEKKSSVRLCIEHAKILSAIEHKLVISPMSMAVLSIQLRRQAQLTIRELGDVIRIVRPETVLKWHRDTKFTVDFDHVFEAEGIHIIKTQTQAPNANAYAERWIRSAREECLDKVIILNEKHLTQVMNEYINYYNIARPHQGIEQQIPIPLPNSNKSGPVRCRDFLGGIIHDYYRDTA